MLTIFAISKGWMGCILCILGATILALNAPETQSVTTVKELQRLWVSPGTLFFDDALYCELIQRCVLPGFLSWGSYPALSLLASRSDPLPRNSWGMPCRLCIPSLLGWSAIRQEKYVCVYYDLLFDRWVVCEHTARSRGFNLDKYPGVSPSVLCASADADP